MSHGSMRCHTFMAAAGALLCGLLASTYAMAQSSQLADMMGIWATKRMGGPSTFYNVYQATTGPASLTLRYVRTDVVTTLPGVSGNVGAKLYELKVTDRSLSGSVTTDTSITADFGCAFEQRTFPVQGRISPDWNTITIVENHETPTFHPCEWKNYGEYVVQFERYH